MLEVKEKSTHCIQIGFHYIGITDYKYERTIFINKGKIVANGEVSLGSGTRISNTGVIILGRGFSISANSSISCRKEIVFGNDVLISWDVYISDHDHHGVFNTEDGCVYNKPETITIGNHVWICCRSTVLKGALINNGFVIAAVSVNRKEV